MNDLISRQAAIDALKKISFSYWFECGEYLSEDTREIKIINSNKALEAIETLPSAQPRWIPSSERLPEHNQKILAYYADIDRIMLISFNTYGITTMTAWMPLPKPYGGENDE